MEFNKEKYDELMLRFAKELNEIGVTRELIDLIGDQLERMPNAVSACNDEVTDRFTYRHDGFMIEATRTVSLVLRKCK